MPFSLVDAATQTLADTAYLESLSLLDGPGQRVSSDEQLQVRAEAKAFLDIDSKKFEMHPITLGFRSKGVEAEYLADVAKRRWPVLIFIFCFDIGSFCLRTMAKIITGEQSVHVGKEMMPQLCNMAMLYTFVAVLNRRSRRHGYAAAKQEEFLLSAVMALAVSFLLTSLTSENAQDYVLVTYFLITTTTFLKLRWLVGAVILSLPVFVVWARCSRFAQTMVFGTARSSLLHPDAMVHILIAWAVGALMSFLAESYRRQMFANHKLAVTAAEKEILEMHARIQAQNELADAQAQAAARALSVAREKAANEAKSDFMSLMCHEVRTPLNGALASVEMLLETPLEDEQRDLAKTIRVSGSILLSTVSNFLDFFKIEAGKQLDIVRSEMDVEQLVGDVHCIIEAMIGRSADLRLLKPDLHGVPTVVLGDPDRVCGILLNLYTNAAKFTKQGFIAVRVRVCGKGFEPDPAGVEQLMALRHIDSQPDAGKTYDDESDLHMSGYMGDASSSTSLDLFDSSQPRSNRSSMNSLDRQEPRLARHSSSREDGMRVWEKQYSAEDGARVRRRLSAEQDEKERLERTSKDGTIQSGRPSAEAGINMVGERPSSAPPCSTTQSAAKGSQTDVAVPRTSMPTSTSTSSPSATAAATKRGQKGKKKVSCEVQTMQPYEIALINSLQESGGPVKIPEPVRVKQVGNGWTSVVGTHEVKGMQPLSDPESGQWLMFEVIDTGHGIAPEGLATLFKQYEQGTDVDMRKPRRRGGTGLGLSICSKQVAVLGGQIGVMSKQDHGSDFWFTIPLLQPRTRSQQPVSGLRMSRPREPHHPVMDANARNDLFHVLSTVTEVAEGRSSGSSFDSGRNQSSAATASPRLTPLGSRTGSSGDPWDGGRPARSGPTQVDKTFAPRSSTGDAPEMSAAAAAWKRLSANSFSGGSASTNVAPPTMAAFQVQGSIFGADGPFPGPSQLSSSTGDGSNVPVSSAPRPWQFDSSAKSWTIPSRRSLDRRTSIDTTALQGRRVLLAEDNLINQTVAKKMLTSLGMQCSVASNGYEAIEALTVSRERGEDFDVVLMDMAMPRMGGVEATKIIRHNSFKLPIVAMTANASDKDRDECLEAGMDGFLSKPVLKDRLAEAMLAALSGHGNFSDETMPSDVFDQFGH